MSMLTEFPFPKQYKARAATMADVTAVVDLMNTCTQAATGEAGESVADRKNAWETPGLDITTDIHLVFAPDNTLVGILEFWDVLKPHIQVSIQIYIHPQYDVQTIGSYLLGWADRREEEALTHALPEGQVVLLAGADGRELAKQQLFQTNGYAVTRYFWRMVLTMDSLPHSPVWPEGIVIRAHVAGQDDYVVYETIEAAFNDHWRHVPIAYEQWQHWNIEDEEFDSSLWFLALDGDVVAGALMGWPTFGDDAEMGLITDLGVRPEWRKRGIGKALLLHAFHEFHRRGILKVALTVDTESSTNAPALYERVGMRPAQSRIMYEKEVRQ
ncbi:MAG: GNAT family N-acetyltransferase [Chloroflexi bacterium]|nr:GNAT family N-acetyltransferase [Chloroflexota bacterium]